MRPFLKFAFWFWGILGFLFCGYRVIWAHGLYELGVGTSVAIMMDIVLWIGGLLMFGLGTVLARRGLISSFAEYLAASPSPPPDDFIARSENPPK